MKMKINRFGMSKKTFIAMVKRWASEQLTITGQRLVHCYESSEALAKCEKELKEIRDVITRTFIEDQDDDVKEFLRCVEAMEDRLTREQAALA